VTRALAARGFTLLPVVLVMSLLAAISFMLNRDNGFNSNVLSAGADHARARYAAEAGLQAVNYTIQQLGCAGTHPISSTPVTESNFGGAAYSAYANNTTGSPVTLTSTGTYNGASVTLTKANAYVYQSGVRTWVTQPGPATSKDTYVSENRPTESYGAGTELQLEKNKAEILIAFDLSPLPPGSRIVRWYQVIGGLQPGAVISLYQQNVLTLNQEVSVKLVTRDWVAGTYNGTVPVAGNPGVTWNRWDGLSPNSWPQGPGLGYDSRTLAVVPLPLLIGWLDLDVTDAALAWTSGVYPNYGVWLIPPGSGSAQLYRYTSSNENSLFGLLAGNRPKLTASYLLPCGASAPA
jgi:Tfp pilus assembly protein PilX